METGDGLLVRLRLTGGILSTKNARAIAACAIRYGNGLVNLSSRANLQLRGVTTQTLQDLISELAELDLLDPSADAEAVRNVIASPLTGLDPSAVLDVRPIAHALEASLTSSSMLHRLPGKFGFLIEDGGCLPLSGVHADIRFEAIVTPDGPRFVIRLGGASEVSLGECEPNDVAVYAARIAKVFLALRGREPGAAHRMRDLVDRAGLASIANAAGLPVSPLPSRRCHDFEMARIVGHHKVGKMHYVGVALPFGRLSGDDLAHLASSASTSGAAELRLTPWRTIIVANVSSGRVESLEAVLQASRFILHANDPRLAVAACPGAPACRSATTPVQQDAERLIEIFSQLAPASIALHVSGCAKGCAHASSTPFTLVGNAGLYDLVENGTAGDRPVVTGLAVAEVQSELAMRIRRHLKEPRLPITHDYVRDGAEIYRRSFALIRQEANLGRFEPLEERIAVRVIHACGMVEIASDLFFSPGMARVAAAAIQDGAPILCDSRMVADGITRSRLPSSNAVICTLNDAAVPGLAAKLGTTRSAAAMELWRHHLGGAIVVVGNAPTALFRLFEMLDEGISPPAAIVGMPVGFVGAAESKEALIADGRVPCVVVRGRKGGSAMAAAAINALASAEE
jgi:precorrin-3B synthase